MAQLKIVATDEIVEKFKKIVLAKHGKLELSVEGKKPSNYIFKNMSIFYMVYSHLKRTH